MSKAAAMGTKLKIGEVVVGSLKSIGGLKLSADTIDVTALDNEDGYKEFVAGMKDGGEVPISGFLDYDNEGQKAIYEAFENGEAQAMSVVFPPKMGATWSFNGVVTAFETGAELEDAVSFDATIKVSGKPTLAATPAPTAEGTQGDAQPANQGDAQTDTE